jgi:hypothetical protein
VSERAAAAAVSFRSFSVSVGASTRCVNPVLLCDPSVMFC